ncbi:MAG: DUF2865 domain-containing protein [Hyphomicrobiaceae bacterium]
MPFPVRRWAAPVCVLVLAAPFASGSDAAYHAAERVTGALMSTVADIAAFERKASDVKERSLPPRIRVAQTGDDWIESLRTGAYWKKNRDASRSTRSAKREKSGREVRRAAKPSGTHSVAKVALAAHTGSLPRRGNGETYRTVCVRLCDGYYWPISSAIDSTELTRDSAKCEQSCSMPAKLYYGPMLGEALDLIDLNGQPYTTLRTAFQFRVSYNPSCKCRAHPWENEAQERHKAYAAREPDVPVAEEQVPAVAAAKVPGAATGPASSPRD